MGWKILRSGVDLLERIIETSGFAWRKCSEISEHKSSWGWRGCGMLGHCEGLLGFCGHMVCGFKVLRSKNSVYQQVPWLVFIISWDAADVAFPEMCYGLNCLIMFNHVYSKVLRHCHETYQPFLSWVSWKWLTHQGKSIPKVCRYQQLLQQITDNLNHASLNVFTQTKTPHFNDSYQTLDLGHMFKPFVFLHAKFGQQSKNKRFINGTLNQSKHVPQIWDLGA